jgi:phosphopantetheinyl transferase
MEITLCVKRMKHILPRYEGRFGEVRFSKICRAPEEFPPECFSEAELCKIRRLFRNERRMYAVMTGRRMLKEMLMERGIREAPGEIEILNRDGCKGIPYAAVRGVHLEQAVSLSYSGDAVSAAIGNGCRIGTDLERIGNVTGPVIRRFFTPGEQRHLQGLNDGNAALRIWCFKEALVKAMGARLLNEALKIEVFENRETGEFLVEMNETSLPKEREAEILLAENQEFCQVTCFFPEARRNNNGNRRERK